MDENNRKIVKNSAYLYIRMMVTMVLGFVVTRIVLEKLGASDYGVYNVVGGFVSLFTVLNSILQGGTRRFLALRIGEGDCSKLKDTFSTAFVIHLGIAIIVFILLETIGLYFVNHKLNIDQERLSAANWVFQCSIVSVVMAITQTPFTAAVTAHEHFNIYAFMSIFDIVGRIIMLLLLTFIPGDKLIIYALIQMLIGLIVMVVYRWYCFMHFQECAFSLRIDKLSFREMIQFSGWSTIGHLSAVLNGQGMSILINLFFNTIMNATRGLASTVIFTINQLVSSFVMAAEPQLVKLYGAGEKEKFHRLIFNVSKYTLFLLAVFITPVLLEIDFVLALWLTEVPDYTSSFIRISLIVSFISYSNKFVDQGVVAIGRVKELNLFVAPLYLLTLPLAYFFLKMGFGPITVYWVSAVPLIIAMGLNLYIIHKYYDFPAMRYIVMVFLKNLMLIFLATIIPWLVQQQMQIGWLRFLVVCSLSVICTLTILYSIGLDDETRVIVKRQLTKLSLLK